MKSIDSMEVECKRRDGSWHPCQISLGKGNSAIIVAYENCGEEEEEDRIESRAEASARLRFRSAFLQGGECSQLIEGQHVLALHDASSSSLFFDAIVKKINRVRHSDRLACRCTFSLKWLASYLQDQNVRVTSTCIMRLSDKNIETHPVFEAFMAATNSSAENGTPAFVSPLCENLFEVELDGLLEKQVQDIIKAQGADCLEDGMAGLKKANRKGLQIKKSPEPSGGRRVTRSKSKQEIEPPPEEAKEKAVSLSFLSPLAARAALASLICTLPVSTLPKQPEKLPVSPETSKEDSLLLSPLAARTYLTSFASALPASGLPKQAKKPPSTPNQSDYNSDTGRRVGVNLGSEKVDPVITRRITRSATKREGVDLMTDIQRTQDQKSRGTDKGNEEAGNSSFTCDVEDVVTPVRTESKKRICSPFASASTCASIVTNTISECEGETCQDAEIQTDAKRIKIVSRKPPTRFSLRLAQLDKDLSQINK